MSDEPRWPRWGPEEVEAYAAELRAEFERLRPLLPDVPPGDLLSILACQPRPFGTGKMFFLKRREDGG